MPNILKRLKDYKVPSDLLEVEVTESVFMSDLNKLTNNLKPSGTEEWRSLSMISEVDILR